MSQSRGDAVKDAWCSVLRGRLSSVVGSFVAATTSCIDEVLLVMIIYMMAVGCWLLVGD